MRVHKCIVSFTHWKKESPLKIIKPAVMFRSTNNVIICKSNLMGSRKMLNYASNQMNAKMKRCLQTTCYSKEQTESVILQQVLRHDVTMQQWITMKWSLPCNSEILQQNHQHRETKESMSSKAQSKLAGLTLFSPSLLDFPFPTHYISHQLVYKRVCVKATVNVKVVSQNSKWPHQQSYVFHWL